MTENESNNDYHKMPQDDSANKFKFYSGDLIIQNKDNDEFLLFFTPKEIDTQCFCGFYLNSGMKIVACFILYIMAFHLLEIIMRNNYCIYFIGTFMCAGYLITLFSIFQALEDLSYDKAVFNYRFFMMLYFAEIIMLVLKTIYVKIYDPIYFSSYTYFGLFGTYFFLIATLLIEEYMVWVTFCFMEHVKNHRLYLLQNINDNDLLAISP